MLCSDLRGYMTSQSHCMNNTIPTIWVSLHPPGTLPIGDPSFFSGSPASKHSVELRVKNTRCSVVVCTCAKSSTDHLSSCPWQTQRRICKYLKWKSLSPLLFSTDQLVISRGSVTALLSYLHHECVTVLRLTDREQTVYNHNPGTSVSKQHVFATYKLNHYSFI